MDRTLRAMIRQRVNDRSAQIKDVIRRTAGRGGVEELIERFDAMATPWTPPARYAV
jgi:hypothetical protein